MAASKSALPREVALHWFEHLSGDVSFRNTAFLDMEQEGLDLPDVVSALETSDTSTATKENPHDAFFSMVGKAPDGGTLRVTVSANSPLRGICVHHVKRI